MYDGAPLLATLDPHTTRFNNMMDELNYFARARGFSLQHTVRLRDSFRPTAQYVTSYKLPHGLTRSVSTQTPQHTADTDALDFESPDGEPRLNSRYD